MKLYRVAFIYGGGRGQRKTATRQEALVHATHVEAARRLVGERAPAPIAHFESINELPTEQYIPLGKPERCPN